VVAEFRSPGGAQLWGGGDTVRAGCEHTFV
jgi:hypothetical protein